MQVRRPLLKTFTVSAVYSWPCLQWLRFLLHLRPFRIRSAMFSARVPHLRLESVLFAGLSSKCRASYPVGHGPVKLDRTSLWTRYTLTAPCLERVTLRCPVLPFLACCLRTLPR